jgi:hypothetical protein
MSKDAPLSKLSEYLYIVAKLNQTGSQIGEILSEGRNTPEKCHMH